MKRIALAVLLVTCVATNAHSQKEAFSFGVNRYGVHKAAECHKRV